MCRLRHGKPGMFAVVDELLYKAKKLGKKKIHYVTRDPEV